MLIGSISAGGVFAAMVDPFAQYATRFYTNDWTLVEQNQRNLPLNALIVYNRLLWLGITTILLVWLYRKFQFQYAAFDFTMGLTPKGTTQKVDIKDYLFQVLAVKLTKFSLDFSLKQQLKKVGQLALFDLKYILKGGLFLSILMAGIAVVIFKQAEINPPYGYETLPMTWKMLDFPMHNASITVIILTFLYAGLLIQRSRSSRMHELVDSTPTTNGVQLLAKLVALIWMQMLLLGLVLIGGVLVQISSGFYDFEIGHYLFELFGLQLVTFVLWAIVALFVQTIFTNAYLGFFMLLMGWAGIAHLHLLGIDHWIFKYNWGPNFHYSDMTGYSTSLPLYFLYKAYWLLFGGFLLIGTYCWWNRGVNTTFLDRFKMAIQQVKGRVAWAMGICLFTFLSLGSFLWYEDQVLNQKWTAQTTERVEQKMKAQYDLLQHLPQPKIKAVSVEVDLYPSTNDYQISGRHTIVNTTDKIIDSLVIFALVNQVANYQFDQATKVLLADTATVVYGLPIKYQLHQLTQPLLPNDTLWCDFMVKNEENTWLRRKSPIVANGTSMQSPILPRIGYWSNKELPDPHAATHIHMHESVDADWVDYEAIISTAVGQTAFAVGDLIKQWTANDRAHFQYKTPQKIPLYSAFFSANYAVRKEPFQGIDLAIYHHPQHDYNAKEMLRGLKAALIYNTQNFGDYPLKQAKIVETPSIYGHGGASFAGTMMVSERTGFISKADTTNGEGANMPFFMAAHEFSHQWWKLQLNPAAAKGSDMLMEALCQYTAMKCFERTFGKTKMLGFLKNERDWYLDGRKYEQHGEPTLLTADRQSYVNYAKGSLAFYTLSEYLGEATLNQAIRQFYDKYRLQPAPFATAVDLVQEIRAVTPDSLQYLITDLFEHITFYDNQIQSVKIEQQENKQHEIDLNFTISKYRMGANQQPIFTNGSGETISFQSTDNGIVTSSLPLADYVEIGIFDENGEELKLQKYKATTIENQLKIVVDQRPVKVMIDPYFKLLERTLEDNTN
ncbi:MAG: M1 family aminopeptidase [Bacteroidota bacterium]